MNISVNYRREASQIDNKTQKNITQSKQKNPLKTTAEPQDKLIISKKARQATEQKNEVTQTSAVTAETNPVSKGTGETTFTSTVIERIKYLNEMREGVKSYYAEAHKENLSFENPERHIHDKYMNSNSSYFRSDLSAEQRELAYRQETSLLRTGDIATLNDANALKSIGMSNEYDAMNMEINQRTRNQITQSIKELFEKNGITIPKDTSFRFTVDPYDFYIRAEGLADKALTEQIEKALNQGDNGMNLYYHIHDCNPANFGSTEPEQYKGGNFWKFSFFHAVKETTRYDLRILRNENDTFYTPDGRDLWEVLMEKNSQSFSTDEYRGVYKYLARNGWNGWSDHNTLGIDYINGSLLDIDTQNGYGPGQTDWQEKLRAVDKNPKKENKGPGLYLLDGTFESQKISLEEWQEKIKNINDSNITRLTKEVLQLKPEKS